MQISLRSSLIAGTAAAMVASTISMTPATPTSMPSIYAANVTLAGLDSPVTEFIASLEMGNQYLFSTGDPGNLTPPSILIGSWWDRFLKFAGLTDTWDPSIGGYSSVGVIPQIIDDALPIISQLGYNGSDYFNRSGTALALAGTALSEGVWNAAGDALSLNIPAALTTLVGSVNVAGTALLDASRYVLANALVKVQAVLKTVVGTLPNLIGVAVAQVAVVVARTVAIVTDTAAALSAGDLTGAWNATVDGVFGPTGLPGTVLALSIGAGVQAGDKFVPSIRTEVQAGVKAIATDLQETAPVPVAAGASAQMVLKPAAKVRAAAPVAGGASARTVLKPAAKVRTAAPVATSVTKSAPSSPAANSSKPAKRSGSRDTANTAAAN